jgi:tetratricopeptide (TPR) repeat protein
LLDFDLELKKLQPININNLELNSYKISEKIKKSIILYNIAIGEMKRKNLDLAINYLKQALSYNKSFFEAIKFIGLCYVSTEEYKKAKRIFKKLARNEIFRELAKEYMESLEIKQSVSKTFWNLKEFEYISNTTMKKHISKKSLRGIIVAVIFMIVATVAIISYFKPLNIEGILGKVQHNSKEGTSNDEGTDSNSDEKDKLSVNDSIHKVNDNAQKNLENTKAETDMNQDENKISDMLKDANTYYENEDYEKSASTLISMRNMNLNDEEKLEFNKLWQDIKTSKVWTIYNEGNELYKKGKYEEALPKIKTASEINPDLDVMPWATFQIGMCYKEIKDYNNANAYFQKVIDSYPKSTYVSNAKMMITEMGY